MHQNAASLPKIKKKYEVLISDKTQLASLRPEVLLAGATVIVDSDEPVYKSDRINASKITVVAQGEDVPPPGTSLEDQIKQAKFIGGIIKEVGDKYLTVGITQIDLSKVKDPQEIVSGKAPMAAKYYKVFFDDKTQFMDKKPNELKVGQFVRASSATPIYSLSEFTATKIQTTCSSSNYSSFPGYTDPNYSYTDSNYSSFSGQLSSKGDNVLTVKASDEYGGRTYTVKISAQTKVVKVDFNNVSSDGKPTVTDASFSDIQNNDQVRILSTSDIERQTEIEALEVGIKASS